MKRILILASLAVCGLTTTVGAAESKGSSREPAVQIALLLDTSNSMDGLIGQAKTQLWSIVNEFIRAKQRDGRTPVVEVALYEYGNDNLSAQEGFVRLVLPMTDDLDVVSEKLFALTTRGGQEFCGQVIRDATRQLTWSQSSGVYKAIFIAGNEPFSQGPVDFHESCRAAIAKGIIVNTIFCGASAEGTRTGWSDGATLADGRFMSIDQNQKVAVIATPQDTEIARLGVDLNKTYIPYGKMGQEGYARQAVQDTNAVNASQAAIVSRSVSKGNSVVYCNDAWDLVDAINTGRCKLDDLKDDDLPAELRKKSKAERQAYVKEKTAERGKIQKRIVELNKEREAFIAAEQKRQAAAAGKETLDTVILKAVREQAARANIRFE
jgi:hypothetical protein